MKKICKVLNVKKVMLKCFLLIFVINFLNINIVIAKELDTLDLEEVFILEDNYINDMKNIVEPFLSSIEQSGYIVGEESVELFYKKYIIEDSKATIVLSHGFSESLEKYNEIIYYFLKLGYSVFAIEHRGHGRSTYLGIDNSQVYVEDFNDYVLDLKTFIDEIVMQEVQGDKLYLFAHSMGGAIGTKFLEDYPEYFDAAVLTGPMMEVNTGSYPKFIARPIAWGMANLGFKYKYAAGEKPHDDVYAFESSGTSSQARYDYTYNNLIENDLLQRGGAAYNWLNESFKVTNEIIKKKNASKVDIPVLLFQAENDTYVKPKGQDVFAQYAKKCELVLVKNSRHDMYRECDEILVPYLQKIIEFLQYR